MSNCALRSLDRIAVPAKAELLARRRAAGRGNPLRMSLAFVLTLILPLTVGEQLATWRARGDASGAGDLGALASAAGSSSAKATDPIKDQTQPPDHTPPPPSRRFSARTADEARQNLAQDPFVAPLAPGTSLGTPLYVRAARVENVGVLGSRPIMRLPYTYDGLEPDRGDGDDERRDLHTGRRLEHHRAYRSLEVNEAVGRRLRPTTGARVSSCNGVSWPRSQ